MATSGSTDFALNSREIIQAAIDLCGARAMGDTPSAEESALGLLHLNLMLKTWATNPRTWLLAEGTQALTASQAAYVLSGVRRVIEVRRRDANSRDIPLGELARDEYTNLPNKSATGVPSSWWFDPLRATKTLYVWYAPDATAASAYTLKYTYQRAIEDVDALNNDPDVPQEWLEALTYGLATRLAIPMKRHIADPVGFAKLEERAAAFLDQLSGQDLEGSSVFLTPDLR